MTAKEYLDQARNLEIKISQIEKEINLLRESASDIGSALSSDVRVKKSISGDAAYTYKAEEIICLEQDLKKLRVDLILKRDEIIRKIHEIENPVYEDILFRRYIEYKSFKQIAKEMNYEYGYIRKLHRKAVNNVKF